jgi:HSP20 family protein
MKRFFSIVPGQAGDCGCVSLYSDAGRGINREMNQFLSTFFADTALSDRKTARKESLSRFTPRIDIDENNSQISVIVELPGLEEKDVNIKLTEDSLTLSGEKKYEEEKKEGEKTLYRESRYGSFERVIPLSGVEIDHDKVSAAMKNGVLTIVLPKSEKAQKKERTVSIKSQH